MQDLIRFLRQRLTAPVICAGALVLIGLGAFGPGVGNDFTTWDDDVYVTRNAAVRDLSIDGLVKLFTSFSHSNYHPLTSLTYRIEYALVGLEPWLYHLDNVLLHLAGTVLVFLLCRRWLRGDGPAFLVGLLFLLHPLRVESVAWVGERKDVLCVALYLGALLAYPFEGEDPRRYGISLGLFVLALLSKVMAITFPAALLVVLVHQRRTSRQEIQGIAPFAALAVAFAVMGVFAQASEGSVKGLHGGSLPRHILTVPVAIAFYAEKLLAPVVLSPRYEIEPATGLLDPRVLVGLVIVALGALAAVRSHRARGPAFLGLALFAVTWAPVSGLVPSSTIVADRYLYLPALGLFLALVGSIDEARRAAGVWRPLLARAGLVVLGLLLAWYVYLTPSRVLCWRDGLTLWADALGENPKNSLVHNQMAIAYFNAGRYAEAASESVESIRNGLTYPSYVFNLCVAYRGLGDGDREIATAREILKEAPDFVPAWMVEARHLLLRGKDGECEKLLDDLDPRFPENPGLATSRGDLEESRGNLDAALDQYVRSMKLHPGDPEVFLAAAWVLQRKGDERRAMGLAQMAVDLGSGRLEPGARERWERLKESVLSEGSPQARERIERLGERCRPR